MGFGLLRAAGCAEWLGGGEEGFDGSVSKNEQRGHCPSAVSAVRYFWPI
jgi:hypothetical protein